MNKKQELEYMSQKIELTNSQIKSRLGEREQLSQKLENF